MKKVLKSSVIVAMVALVVMLAASCGAGKFSTVDAYAKSEAVQSEIESVKESFADTFEVNVYGEGNTLVYEYKYVTQIDDSVLESVKTALENATEGEKDTFVDAANSITEFVDISKEDVAVAVRYLNADGTLIAESVFKAE